MRRKGVAITVAVVAQLQSLLLSIASLQCNGFIPQPTTRRRTTTSLFGITEWRDQIIMPNDDDDDLVVSDDLVKREICILPFPYDEVLLQGETKQLRLYEDRFVKLFDHAMERNCGMIAMGLIEGSGIIQTVSLCEMEAFHRMEGFGIFVTIRAVGRARLVEITQQEPHLVAICTEMNDEYPKNNPRYLEFASKLASDIETNILQLASMEYRLENDEEGLSKRDEEMKRRIMIAKLEDRFYKDAGEDDEDENDEVLELDRKSRYRQAYEVAMETDTQGYTIQQKQNNNKKPLWEPRSPQELSAVSWAAFCTEIIPDAVYRIQALDCDNLMDRLKLALFMLGTKKDKLKALLDDDKAGDGLPPRRTDEDDVEM